MDYKFKFINDGAIEELNAVWKEHGPAMEQFGLECAMAGISGYKKALKWRVFKGCVGAMIVSAVAIGISNYFLEKEKEEKARKEAAH